MGLKSLEDLKRVLEINLTQSYTVPGMAEGGHDIQHVTRMLNMYGEISELIPGVDKTTYEVTVWLHNLDRLPVYQGTNTHKQLAEFLQERFLSDVEPQIAGMIIDAVLRHGKKDDEPTDSPLLQSLRLADKWDRVGILGATAGFEWLGCKRPSYNLSDPFGYNTTAEKGLKTGYQGLFRIVEWYAAFPLIRQLVQRHPWKFRHLLYYIRAYAREVSEAHSVENTVESDLKKAMGGYYDEWSRFD